MVICVACNADLDFEEDELDEGDEFTCDECGANLRVIGVNPVELEPVDSAVAGGEEDDDEDDLDDDEEDEEDEEDEDDDLDEDDDGEDSRWR
ncbi:MAG: hypothetical protein SFV18_11810 [Bryobacteraceae bacterium]|nr:hypothetical protein [Bryobacteraceae bacterium]